MKTSLPIIASLILLPILVIAAYYQPFSQRFDKPASLLKGLRNENSEESEIIAQNIDPQLDPQLLEFAKNITVKVTTDRTGGSGVIFAKKNNTYLVLSSGHVIRDSKSITIQTVDGITYQANLIPMNQDLDLALLEFTSENAYEIASLNYKTFPRTEEKILAVGYATETGELVNIDGKITQIPDKKLKLGYQIGFTGDLLSGMSGGAIVIADEYGGDLIGINGIGRYPILNTGYTYQDGTNPTVKEIELMREVSWGIPIYTLLSQIDTEILNAYNIEPPSTVAEIENIPLTGWLGELEQKAKAITVRIENTNGLNNGSGIIVAKEGDVYAVLTVDHVICEKKPTYLTFARYFGSINFLEVPNCKDFNYEIVAPDGQRYPIERSSIKRQEGVDLAVVRFRSDRNYQIAEFANYSVKNNDPVFVAGYPRLSQTRESEWLFSLGYGLEKEWGLLEVNDSSLTQDSSSFVSSEASLAGGYELVYTSITYGGMSGGAVLDREGRVIGIHGLAEGESIIEESSGNTKKIQLGYSLGIPINAFLGLQKKFDLKQLQIQDTPVREFNPQEKDAFETAILSVEIPQGNAEAYQWLQRGNQLWRLKRYPEAVQAFDKAIAPNAKSNYLAHYGKGMALKDRGANRETLESFEQATIANPNFAPAFSDKSAVLSKLNQLESALVVINEAIALQENNANLYNQKANILSSLKSYKEAEAAFNQAIAKSPSVAFFNNRGILYYNQQKWDLALDDYNQALALNPELADAYNNRGVLYANQQKWDLALADYHQALALNPEFADAYNNRGVLYANQQKWNLALAAYNQALALNPAFADAYRNRNIVYVNQKKWDSALADYNQALALNPEDSEAYYNRGDFYIRQEQWDLALADYNQALALNPEATLAYYNRVNLFKKQEQWDLALAAYNQALALTPEFADAYNNRGLVYANQQKWDLALDDYNQALALNPEFANAYNNRGVLYANQQKWDLALAAYNKALAFNPKDVRGYNARGLVYFEQKQWDLALADFNKALALNPEAYSAYINRGVLYYKQKQWNLALADYNQALALNPEDSEAYYNRGDFYIRQEQWDLALADLNKALALNPEDAKAYNSRGFNYYKQKQWDLALADLNKAIVLNPEDASAYNNRGNLYYNQKQWDLALADYNQAISLNPEGADAYFHRGNLYAEQEQWDLALADLNKAISLNPEDASAYFHRGNLYAEQEQWDLALADLNKAIALDTEFAGAYESRGRLYEKQEQWDLALADFNKALALNPEYAIAYRNRGYVYYNQEKWDLALDNFQQAIDLDLKDAEPQLALAVTLFTLGESEKALSMAKTALSMDKRYADVEFLKENLWGDRLIADTEKLLSHPQIQALLAQLTK